MLNRWSYSQCVAPSAYGSDDTYRIGMDFLAGLDVEDWGCGTSYAKYFQVGGGRYTGIDGSWSRFVNIHVDLRKYRSKTPGLFMRHVLEHNPDWSDVFSNAIASFQRRMVLVLFTPVVTETRPIAVSGDGIVDIAFSLDDLHQICPALRVQIVESPRCQYFRETVLFYLKV